MRYSVLFLVLMSLTSCSLMSRSTAKQTTTQTNYQYQALGEEVVLIGETSTETSNEDAKYSSPIAGQAISIAGNLATGGGLGMSETLLGLAGASGLLGMLGMRKGKQPQQA